eukprot:TRINITY_DN8127_c0_g1_i1.p1 TRINITY_DN8127_c0_g1~~TRINITY_DN8127_c0_g1_i1.p1  ORF type:complete len:270 (-),score=43.52 TRINITY_DN8127_c0_g1_i1:13-822(-)
MHKLNVSGATLASLLLDVANSQEDNEGFFFGNTTFQKASTIDDSSIAQTETIVTAIQGFVTLGAIGSFYSFDTGIHLDDTILHQIFQRKTKNQQLIGWFKFRRNTELRPSLRELEIHKKLFEFQKRLYSRDISPELLFGVFSQSKADSFSINSIDYRFFHTSSENHSCGQFQPITLNLSNLENSAQVEYASFNPLSSQTLTHLFHENVKKTYTKEKPPLYVQHLERSFHQTLDNLTLLAESVSSSNQEIAGILHEINALSALLTGRETE